MALLFVLVTREIPSRLLQGIFPFSFLFPSIGDIPPVLCLPPRVFTCVGMCVDLRGEERLLFMNISFLFHPSYIYIVDSFLPIVSRAFNPTESDHVISPPTPSGRFFFVRFLPLIYDAFFFLSTLAFGGTPNFFTPPPLKKVFLIDFKRLREIPFFFLL